MNQAHFTSSTEDITTIPSYIEYISAYCLVAIIQHDMKLDRSNYEVLQILGISLTDKTPLRDLFDKTKPDLYNEQIDELQPKLFDF